MKRKYVEGIDKIVTLSQYVDSSVNGSVFHLNDFSQGLGKNQRNGCYELVESISLRFSMELPESAMVFPRRYKVFWAIVEDNRPGRAVPTVDEIFKMTVPPIEGLEYIADDMHHRFEVKKCGVGFLQSSGIHYTVEDPVYPAFNIQDYIVREELDDINVIGSYLNDSPFGSVANMLSGALYFVVNPTFDGYIGYNISVRHSELMM